VAAAVAQALATRDPTKGTGGLARRAMVRGVAGRPRPLLVVIPPPEGAGRGGWSDQPPGPRPGCWWCGLMAV
jgi:hypothetical protein